MMKTAFAYWDKRIAPVFDTARHIHLVEVDAGRIVTETQEVLADDLPVQKALHLSQLGIETLVCGAISRPLQALVTAYGIQVIPFVAGELGEVIQAWLSGNLTGDLFAMPGCCGRGRRRFLDTNVTEQEENTMNGRRGNGPGQGRGMGTGGGQGGTGIGGGRGQGRGRMGGFQATGTVGMCLCPKCGHRQEHERGIPCVQTQCPKCGTSLTREKSNMEIP
jgi:predicted Fe-Mo cluster-binding NifX family protein